jgi:hypothetical protein
LTRFATAIIIRTLSGERRDESIFMLALPTIGRLLPRLMLALLALSSSLHSAPVHAQLLKQLRDDVRGEKPSEAPVTDLSTGDPKKGGRSGSSPGR